MGKVIKDTSVKISDWLEAEDNDNLSRENETLDAGGVVKCGQLVIKGANGKVKPYDWAAGGAFYGIALSDADGGTTGAKLAVIARRARVIFDRLSFEFPASSTGAQITTWKTMAKDQLATKLSISFAQ